MFVKRQINDDVVVTVTVKESKVRHGYLLCPLFACITGCEIGQPSNDSCIFQCPFDGHLQNVCNCQPTQKTLGKFIFILIM